MPEVQARCMSTVEPGNTEHTFTFNINLKIVRDSLTAFLMRIVHIKNGTSDSNT
jgi:hypothetical protein